LTFSSNPLDFIVFTAFSIRVSRVEHFRVEFLGGVSWDLYQETLPCH
jgi:hypothetical protein